MTLLLVRDDRTYLVTPGDRLETDLGIIEVPAGIDAGSTIESHLGESFRVIAPRMTDLFDQLDRAGAPLLPRDVGLIVGMAGLQAGHRVLDVGTGSGILAIALARLGMAVTTFERDADVAAVARRNVETAGVADAITLEEADATTATIDDRFDAITLDTGDAADLVEAAPAHLVAGGTLAAYSPFVEGARAAASAARSTGLSDVVTVETIQREMDFGPRGSRPSTGPVGHSGYLTLARHLPADA